MTKAVNNLVTKPFLKQELKQELGKLKKDLKDDFTEKFDQVMEELKGIREDFDIFVGKYGEIRDQVEDNEERIIKLEQKPT